jgi:hypothetical protein
MPDEQINQPEAIHPGPDAADIELGRKRELLARAQLLQTARRRTNLDSCILNPKPGMHYSWVRNDPTEIMGFKARGYEISRTPGKSPKELQTPYRREDGGHRFADVILMQIDEQDWLAQKQVSDFMSRRAVQKKEQDFLGWASRAGLSPQMLSPQQSPQE